MRTETVTREIFTFDELSDDAKEVARNWWRDVAGHDDWYEPVEYDFHHILGLLGFTGVKSNFAGFRSQGDGASFTADYSYSKGGAKSLKEYAPRDSELHRIADALQDLQRRNFYRIEDSITRFWRSGNYVHSGTMTCECDALLEICRDLADWYYAALEREYEYLMSDESVNESIRANEYEFLESGERA